MTTKKKTSKNNKTRKHKFNENTIPVSLKIASKNSYNELDREKSLACYLANNDKVINFASKIFYYMLLYWKKHYPKKWKEIIGNELLENVEGNIINNIGFNIKERNEIYKFIDNADKEKFFTFLKDKFLKTTSVLNNLSKPDFSYYHVNINKILQNKFISNLKKLFLINDITWHHFSKIYNNIDDNLKKSYDFFIFDIIIYGGHSNKDLSLYKKNLTYLDFIKKKVNSDCKNNPKNLQSFYKCSKSAISENKYKDFKIYDAKNIYDIEKHSPYSEIMKEYGEPYLGGPSGSASILFTVLFEFYGYPKNKTNKIMLLCLIIADYIPLWHTLPEILLSTNIEMESETTPSYTINKESVHYVYSIIKNYIY
jgi:hypothetical protein